MANVELMYNGAKRADFQRFTRQMTWMGVGVLRDEALGEQSYAGQSSPAEREIQLSNICTRGLMIGSYA